MLSLETPTRTWVRTCAIARIPNLPAANAEKPFPPLSAAVAPVNTIEPRVPSSFSFSPVAARIALTDSCANANAPTLGRVRRQRVARERWGIGGARTC